MQKNEGLTLLLNERYSLLRIIQILFQQPMSHEIIALLKAPETRTCVELFSTENPDMGIFLDELDEVAASDSDTFCDEARREYNMLFVGPGKPAAPFWESVYLDERELLFLPSTSDVRMRYAAEGFKIAGKEKQAEDAVHYQFDFLASLAWKMSEALDVDALDELSRLARVSLDFETDHMLNWLPKMAQRASDHSTHFFYPQLCTFAAAMIDFDSQLLEEIVQYQTS